MRRVAAPRVCRRRPVRLSRNDIERRDASRSRRRLAAKRPATRRCGSLSSMVVQRALTDLAAVFADPGVARRGDGARRAARALGRSSRRPSATALTPIAKLAAQRVQAAAARPATDPDEDAYLAYLASMEATIEAEAGGRRAGGAVRGGGLRSPADRRTRGAPERRAAARRARPSRRRARSGSRPDAGRSRRCFAPPRRASPRPRAAPRRAPRSPTSRRRSCSACSA